LEEFDGAMGVMLGVVESGSLSDLIEKLASSGESVGNQRAQGWT
jgi:hypothetical protein